jgi:hypothetical protein
MLCEISCIIIYCIIVNITVSFYFTSDRKKVRTSENPTATDMYGNIEETTKSGAKHQRKRLHTDIQRGQFDPLIKVF